MGDIERRPPIFMGSFFLNHPPRQVKPHDGRPILGTATQLGIYSGIAGTILGGINYGVIAPTEANRGFLGKVAKYGGMTAAVGFTFGAVSQTVASLRNESDLWNAAAGGCASGFLLGIRAGQLPTAIGQCVLWGSVAGGVNFAGDTLVPAHSGKSKAQQQEERVKLLGDKDPLLTQSS